MLRLLAFALVIGVLQAHSCDQEQHRVSNQNGSVSDNSNQTVKIKLLDAYSTETIANSEVEMHSDNGMRCIQPPCDSNTQIWNGQTNNAGIIAVPRDFIQLLTIVSTPAHRGGKNIDVAEKDADGNVVIELDPNHTFDGEPHKSRFKLIDAQSNAPLNDVPFRIEFGRGSRFDGTTNALGYIYFPTSELGLSGYKILAQSSSASDRQAYQRASGEDWIIARGYKKTKLVVHGRANYKLRLERE